jgi:DNA-binding transcriptional MerR regulator
MASRNDRLSKALRRYQAGVFTDADVTRCTGLSARSIRELIKRGAVRTLSEDRGAGRIRTFDAPTFKRLALLAAINEAGFSLKLAGQMAYLVPSDNLLYWTYDPINALPPRLEMPRFDWFDPDKPATADPENDWLLEVYDGRFVAQVFQRRRGTSIYGDLRKAGTEFVSWWPFQAQLNDIFSNNGDAAPKWEGKRLLADRIDPKFLDYRYENHVSDDDPLKRMAYAAAQRPIVTTTINVTLAIRLALRRYLGIEPLARTLFASANVSTRDRVTAKGSLQVRGNKVGKRNDRSKARSAKAHRTTEHL